jgi:hypothetical protein
MARFRQFTKGQLHGRSKGGGQVGPAYPRILLAHPRIKVKHIKNNIHLQSIYLSSVCGLKSGPPQQKIIATPLVNFDNDF